MFCLLKVFWSLCPERRTGVLTGGTRGPCAVWSRCNRNPNYMYGVMVSDLSLVVRLVGTHRIPSRSPHPPPPSLHEQSFAWHQEMIRVTEAPPADCPHQILAFAGLHDRTKPTRESQSVVTQLEDDAMTVFVRDSSARSSWNYSLLAIFRFTRMLAVHAQDTGIYPLQKWSSATPDESSQGWIRSGDRMG